VCLQFDNLNDDQKEMLKMLHDTCVGESSVDEGKFSTAQFSLRHPSRDYSQISILIRRPYEILR